MRQIVITVTAIICYFLIGCSAINQEVGPDRWNDVITVKQINNQVVAVEYSTIQQPDVINRMRCTEVNGFSMCVFGREDIFLKLDLVRIQSSPFEVIGRYSLPNGTWWDFRFENIGENRAQLVWDRNHLLESTAPWPESAE